MIIANLICYALVIIGALNWALVGAFDLNLVALIFGGYRAVGSIILYFIIFAAALWLIISPIITEGRLYIRRERESTSSVETKEYKKQA